MKCSGRSWFALILAVALLLGAVGNAGGEALPTKYYSAERYCDRRVPQLWDLEVWRADRQSDHMGDRRSGACRRQRGAADATLRRYVQGDRGRRERVGGLGALKVGHDGL